MTKAISSHSQAALLGLCVLAGSGCAYMPGASPVVEEDFGNSVRNMVSRQTYDPRAAESPQQGISEGLDGTKAGLGLKTYHTEAGTGRSVRATIESVMGD